MGRPSRPVIRVGGLSFGEGSALRVYAGLDLASKGKHKVFVVSQNGEAIASGLSFATEASEMTRVREKIRAEIWWISEPTGTQWMTVGHYFVGSGDSYFLVSNQKAHDLRRFTARQERLRGGRGPGEDGTHSCRRFSGPSRSMPRLTP